MEKINLCIHSSWRDSGILIKYYYDKFNNSAKSYFSMVRLHHTAAHFYMQPVMYISFSCQPQYQGRVSIENSIFLQYFLDKHIYKGCSDTCAMSKLQNRPHNTNGLNAIKLLNAIGVQRLHPPTLIVSLTRVDVL